MTMRFVFACLLLLAIGATTPVAVAQEPPRAAAGRGPVTAVIVEVTVSRYLGDKQLSSTPYTLAVGVDNRSSLRMGGDVPVPSTTFAPVAKDDPNAKATPITSYGYRTIGTSIDVQTAAGQDGQYKIGLTIDESSIYPPELAPATTKTTGAPAFRSFKSTNTVSLRDGQALQYTMATDRLTGEVYRVTVKMTIEK